MSYESDVIDLTKDMENAPAYRRDALEQDIITLTGNERYQTNHNFREHANALRIVKAGLKLHDLLETYVSREDVIGASEDGAVGYANKLNDATRSMYGARNVEILDVIIPGPIPEIGSAWATARAAKKASEASQMLSEIGQIISGSEYVADIGKFGPPNTNLLKEMEGLDLFVNMVRGGMRIDVTSIINVFELSKNANRSRAVLQSLLEFIQKLKRLEPAQKRLDDMIVNWSYEEWDRIKTKYYESL